MKPNQAYVTVQLSNTTAINKVANITECLLWYYLSCKEYLCILWELKSVYFFQSSDYTKPEEIDPTPVTSPKDPEDIPTFDEWKKKVMEVEKEKSKSALWPFLFPFSFL